MKSLGRGWRRIDPFNGFYVYAFWGEHETRPLYIGKSSNLHSRLGGHFNTPEKRALVRHVTVVKCRSREHMDQVETELIQKHRPSWNKAGLTTSTGKPRRHQLPWEHPPVVSAPEPQASPKPSAVRREPTNSARAVAALEGMFGPPPSEAAS